LRRVLMMRSKVVRLEACDCAGMEQEGLVG